MREPECVNRLLSSVCPVNIRGACSEVCAWNGGMSPLSNLGHFTKMSDAKAQLFCEVMMRFVLLATILSVACLILFL